MNARSHRLSPPQTASIPALLKYHYLGYAIPITYLLQISLANTYSRENLLWDNHRSLVMVTASFAYNDYYRWYWLCLTSLVSIFLIGISGPVCDHFSNLFQTARARRKNNLLLHDFKHRIDDTDDADDSEEEEEDKDYMYDDHEAEQTQYDNFGSDTSEIASNRRYHSTLIRTLRLSMITWPLLLQCVVIFIQGRAPQRSSSDGIPNSMWLAHYIFVVAFLTAVLTEMVCVQLILSRLQAVDKKGKMVQQDQGTNITEIHRVRYKNFLILCYFGIALLMLSAAFLAVRYDNDPIWWDVASGCEFIWILIIILYNLDLAAGVARGLALQRSACSQ